MTMARFAPKETIRYRKHADAPEADHPASYAFVWEVNTVRPGTFGRPLNSLDADDNGPGFPADRPGYVTEHYATARIIWGPGDEGCRIVADDDATAEAFRTAARNLGITIAG